MTDLKVTWLGTGDDGRDSRFSGKCRKAVTGHAWTMHASQELDLYNGSTRHQMPSVCLTYCPRRTTEPGKLHEIKERGEKKIIIFTKRARLREKKYLCWLTWCVGESRAWNLTAFKGEVSPNNNVDWVSRKQFYKPNSKSLSRFG